MNPETFQSQLNLYLPIYSINYWPGWFVVLIIVLCIFFLMVIIHALLRLHFRSEGNIRPYKKVYLYPLSIRLWHAINGFLFITLLLTGMINHFSIVNYHITAVFIKIHKVTGYLLTVAWCFYILYNAFSGNSHHYFFKRPFLIKEMIKQFNFYFHGIFGHKNLSFVASIEIKFNPLQQVVYLFIMYLFLPLLIVTGFVLLYPDKISFIFDGMSHKVLVLHFILGFFSVFFIISHVYLCTTGRKLTDIFKGMFDGYYRH